MDPVALLLKSVREAQAELAAYVKAGEHDPKATIKKLNEILATDELLKATRDSIRRPTNSPWFRQQIWTSRPVAAPEGTVIYSGRGTGFPLCRRQAARHVRVVAS